MLEKVLRLPAGSPAFHAMGFLFAVTFLNALSYSIILPVLPNLMKALAGGVAPASQWTAALAALWAVIQLFCAPLLGALSDRVGRRPVLLLSLFGLGVDFFVMALAPDLWWLVVGRALNGLTASTSSVARAYIADITPPEKRAEAYGWMSSAGHIGVVAGPLLGGALALVDLRLPFVVAGVLTALNWLWGLLTVQESLPQHARAPSIKWRNANPIASLAFLRKRGALLRYAFIGFLSQAAYLVGPTIFVLYGGYRYGWNSLTAGIVLVISIGLSLLVQVALVRPVVARFSERGAMLIGAVSGATGLALIALASTGWLYVAAMPVVALVGLLHPGLMSLMTRGVSESEQGLMQGAYQSLLGIAAIIGPITYGLSFAAAVGAPQTSAAPGLPYLIAAACLALAALLAWTSPRPSVAPPLQ